MRITVKGLQENEYAEMRRNGSIWDICLNGHLVNQIPNGDVFKNLGLDKYRLLGLGNDEARVIRFADLHRHSDCSLLDGMTKISDMVAKTEYAGALTDHGAMYGFLEYYKTMKAAGKKPIIGFEGYMENLDGELKGRHIILLAKNDIGVKNLFKLTSDAYDNFKRKPHITWEMLIKHSDGVICLSACLAGIIPTALLNKQEDVARAAIEKFISIFGKENFYIEIQRHHLYDEDLIRGQLVALAKEYDLKYVATSDAHYPNKEDSYTHEVLLCLQTGKTMGDPNHLRYDGDGYYLMNSEEMEELFKDYPEALDTSLEIAEKCNIDLKLNDVNMPKYDVPEPFKTMEEYFEYLVHKGFKNRFQGTAHENDPVYKERFDYELNMIKQMGFEDYFIVVWDFINYARTHNIYVGPGRGSAAGSIIAYCLGITDLDPIKYNLLFERFLNPERVSMPDIDSDIEFSKRPEVIRYMVRKYGAENVCHIVTFGTLAAKQAVKDVGRCLGMPASYNANLSSMIPQEVGMTIDKALNNSPDFKNIYESDANAKRIIDIAKKLEGNKRHASQHACGLVLSPSPVSDFLPTSMEIDDQTQEKSLTSQVIMTEVEELSLIKMDLLGLKNLGVIHEVIDRIQENYGKETILKQIGSSKSELVYQDIPLTDRETYKMMAQGLTGGVFQMESEGMTKLIGQMLEDIDTLPDDRLEECFERLIAAVALYRPGPMDYIPNYIAGMQDVHNIHYLTPELESLLKPTYGVIVYQEQVMQIVQKLAGYSLGRADLVRKAMGKKKQKIMDAEKAVFIYGNKEAYESGKDAAYAPGCVANGIPEEIAQEIWAQMADFAKYAFNRSHAACYAYIAYITAYMSCHWTEEFYAALLNAFIENSDKVKSYLSQAAHRNVHLLPPDINLSDCNFKAEKGNIRFGLQGISGVKSIAKIIIDEREKGGKFNSLQNLYERMADRDEKLNKRAFEGLVYAGALNCLHNNKAAMLAYLPLLDANYKYFEISRKTHQPTLFPMDTLEVDMPDVPMMSEKEELQNEYDMLGMYLSKHPTDNILQNLAPSNNYIPLEDLSIMTNTRKCIQTVGLIKNFRRFYTKTGKEMCTFTLETKFASLPVVVFPDKFSDYSVLLFDNTVIGINGDLSLNNQGSNMQIIVREVLPEYSLIKQSAKPVVISINNKAEQDSVLLYIKHHPGFTPVHLECNKKIYPLKAGVNLTPSAVEFFKSLKKVS